MVRDVDTDAALDVAPKGELTKKTTILFSDDFYDRLAVIAAQRRTSVGQLVRDACKTQYSISTRAERLGLVQQLAALRLPAGSVEEIERESVPAVEPLP